MDTSEAEISKSKSEDAKLLFVHDECDIYDYLIAAGCGVIGGLIDIFLVGVPGDSKLCQWTDTQVDKVVMSFARKMGWNLQQKNLCNVNSAIGFLEHGKNNGTLNDFQGFKVNYDQRKPGDVGDCFNIAPKTHHMMSLAHSPDIVGLFFSILNQFTSTASFIADGKLVTIATETFELQGGNIPMKIMCGVANWFGHLMSDVAGSSGSHGRGTGIVLPFYEFFGFCKSGGFSTESGVKDLSEIAMQLFTEGYDFRFGLAMTIPVLITDLTIRLAWALRRHFQDNVPLKECIPTKRHDDLRIMLLIGNGTLCVMDGVDAAMRSGGSWLTFFLRLNIVAWYRFISLVLREVCIRLGISFPLQKQIDAYIRINEALMQYMEELKKIDYKRFVAETQQYNECIALLERSNSPGDLTIALKEQYIKLGMEFSWQGDFDSFMQDDSSLLRFK